MPVVDAGPWFRTIQRELLEIQREQLLLLELGRKAGMKREQLYVKSEKGRYSEASDEVIIGRAMTIMMERGLTSTVAKVIRDLFAIAGTEVQQVRTPSKETPAERLAKDIAEGN